MTTKSTTDDRGGNEKRSEGADLGIQNAGHLEEVLKENARPYAPVSSCVRWNKTSRPALSP